MDMMRSQRDEFMQMYNNDIWRCAQSAGGERGERMLQMWVDDVRHANDTRPVGFYAFECDVLALKALKNAQIDWTLHVENPDPEAVKMQQARAKIMASAPGSAMDFDFARFGEWERWTVARCIVHDIDTDHMNIKSHDRSLELIYEALRNVMAPAPP
mmetsp:Transcript_24566/g.53618  ORF Transcript_24566/g.53618 Transcript_24566/m.53618 type:complete len:157 (+) Transcript_24566:3-473(+)